ncbi:MAG: phosphatidylglycerophosphatase A family protein [Ignavibacteria bacterium]
MRIIKSKNVIDESYTVNPLIIIIGSGIFTGFIPIASGTFGAFIGFLIFLIPGFSNYTILSISIIIVFIIGVIASEIMQRRYGYDPPEVVIDEIVGLWFTYLVAAIVLDVFIQFKTFTPDFNFSTKIVFGLTGFFIFRLFDIIKLPPSKYFDEVKSGYGIMMDDIVSGFYAGVLSAVFSHFLWYRIFAKLLS